MVERIKNKKGFTIIEIMVVIALIGILAAVLVPKFGGVKDTAKNTGVLTNVKMVEAYVASQIDSYKAGSGADLATAITTQFTGDKNELINPITGNSADAIDINFVATADAKYKVGPVTDDGDKGKVFVVIDKDTMRTYINGFDANGNEITATERTVEK